jgi:hypothetical protein
MFSQNSIQEGEMSKKKRNVLNRSLEQQHIEQIIEEAIKNAEEAKKKGESLLSDIQETSDLGNRTLPMIPFLHPTEYENLMGLWENNKENMILVNKSFSDINFKFSLSSGTTSSAFDTTSVAFTLIRSGDPVRKIIGEQFMDVVDLPHRKEKAIALFHDLNLDKPLNNVKTPLEQFEIAFEAYEHPVTETNPAITSLVPMRECIRTLIDILLKLRKEQETASGERVKIISIGMNLRKNSITESQVNEWADEWHRLDNEDLSTSKNRPITREEWTSRITRATLFLDGFLDGLDRDKFRK